MPLNISRQLVLKKLEIVFPNPIVAKEALRSLDTYGDKEFQPCKEGVHLAILKLSEGRLWRLRELVRSAKKDFRDVLYLAQAPEYFRKMQELIPDPRRSLPAKERVRLKKKLTATKEATIQKRDHDQWMAWLNSSNQ